MSRRRIILPDGTQGEIIRELADRNRRVLEVAYRRLPDGEEQRVYFDHGCPVCECRECGPHGDDARCRCTAACGDGGTDWLPGQHPALPPDPDDPEQNVPGRVY